jgi:hypothetical protein
MPVGCNRSVSAISLKVTLKYNEQVVEFGKGEITMKQLYFTAWALVAATSIVLVLTGTFNAIALVAFSLVAVGLVHALALWAVFTNTGEITNRS